MIKSEEYTHRIAPRKDAIHPPRYPTILPKTICNEENDWGSWHINRELDSQDIQKRQEECQNNRNDLISVMETIERPEIPKVDSRPVVPAEKAKQPKSFRCMAQLEKEFPKINHYCRDKNKNPLDFAQLAQSVCENGSFDITCTDTNNFRLKRNRGSCATVNVNDDNYPGLYMCYGGVSCTPCSFSRLEMEERLHRGFLNKHCYDLGGGNECRNHGYNLEKELSYQRGNRFRSFHE